MNPIHKISFIGAGNVASHLAPALKESEYSIVQVYSRTIVNAELLSKEVRSKSIDNLEDLDENVDLFIISVPDDCIESISNRLPKNVPAVHTSGSVNLNIFAGRMSGIFYPLQTFSKKRKIELEKVPFLIESEDEKFQEELVKLAGSISTDVRVMDSEKRAAVHLAAVFASNFTNELLAISKDILSKQNLNLYLLLPLIQETIAKAMFDDPRKFQTGPAVRGDNETIKRHLESLSSEGVKNIYSLLSAQIKNMKK